MSRRKPWEQVPAQSNGDELLSHMSAQRSGLEQEITDPIEIEQIAAENAANPPQSSTPTTATSRNLNTYGGGLGGMGYGGMGYGGMGMGMGLGGMGMYGRYGNMDPNSNFMQTLQFMDSFSFVINSMTQVVGSLENNTSGLMFLGQCLKSLYIRIVNYITSSIDSWKLFLLRLTHRLMILLRLAKRDDDKVEPEIELDLTDEELSKLKEVKKRKRIYKFLMKVCGVLIAISLIYFYSVGRSFKVKFIHSRRGTSAPPSNGEGLDALFPEM